MNIWTPLLWTVLGLSARQPGPTNKPTSDGLPDEIEVLKVAVRVTPGGGFHFIHFKVDRRTAGRLSLALPGHPALTSSLTEPHRDPGTPVRSGSVEVVVNGQFSGTVSVRWGGHGQRKTLGHSRVQPGSRFAEVEGLRLIRATHTGEQESAPAAGARAEAQA